MRASRVLLILAIAACGEEDDPPPPFEGSGGSLAIQGCDYAVTTRMGAEKPRVPKATELGPDPSPKHLHLGLVGDPRTSMVVQWRTADDLTRATKVRWAAGDNLAESALTESTTGVEFGYRVLGTQVYRVHQVHLCGLQPATTYSYQAGTDGHYSPVYTFTTAPDVVAKPDAEVVLGVVGDSRAGYAVWQQLIAQLTMRTPDLIVYTGDAVTIGITQFEWEEFLTGGEALFARTPLIFTNGNHEANAVNFYSQFAQPGDQQNFGLDYGHAHITVANDTPEEPSMLTTTVVDALRADFEASKGARWKLLTHHQGLWSASNHGNNAALQQAWGPLIDQYKIDLVLNGHDHNFEITKPMLGQTPQPTNATGTVYMVAGGAGAELYASGTGFWTQYSESTHSAAIVRVRRDQLAMDPFRPDGTAIPGSFTKSKP